MVQHPNLSEEINLVISKKTRVCDCNPCKCTKAKKEDYFKRVLSALERRNNEYLVFNLVGEKGLKQLKN